MTRLPPLTDEQVLLIGEIAVAFGAIEGTAAFMAGLLVEPDIETGLLVGAGDSLKGHLARLERLAHYRLEKPLAEHVAKWCAAVSHDLAPTRNVVLHGAWVTETSYDLYKMVRTRRGTLKREEFDIERLRAARDLAVQLRNEALNLAAEIDMAPKWAGWLRDPGRTRPRWEEPEPSIDDSSEPRPGRS